MNEPPELGAGEVDAGGARGMQIGDGNTQLNFFGPVALGGSPFGEGLRWTRRGPLRVFLSHTGELSEFPVGGSFVAAAKRAVERAGHAVVEMDTWTAADHPPSQVDARKLVGCDVYVGIVGFQWGSPVREDPARSYTEAEFDTAGKKSLPRLVFMLAEDLDVTVPQRFYLDTEHGDRQEVFRARIDASGITRAMVTSPKDLELLLHQALVELAVPPVISQESSPSASTSPQVRGTPGWLPPPQQSRRLAIALGVVLCAGVILVATVLFGGREDNKHLSDAKLSSPTVTKAATPRTNSSPTPSPLAVAANPSQRDCLSSEPLRCVLGPAITTTGNSFSPKIKDHAALTATASNDASCHRTSRPGCLLLLWDLPPEMPNSSATFGVTYGKGIDLTHSQGGLDLTYRLRRGKLAYFEIWIRDTSQTALVCKIWKNLDSHSWHTLHIRFNTCEAPLGGSGPSIPINWAKISELDIVLNSASGTGSADVDEITFRA